jgi:glutamine synthetase
MFAPNANSYRRFQIDNYVPMNTHWSYNNRTVALRIPASNNQNRRIEHRVSGADANPYLVVAAVLGGIHTGLTKELECSDPIIGNAYAKTEPTNPNQWMDAINIFSSSQWAKECFGKEFHHLFSTMKQGEQALFDQQITPLEYQWYLNSV